MVEYQVLVVFFFFCVRKEKAGLADQWESVYHSVMQVRSEWVQLYAEALVAFLDDQWE